MRRWNAPFDVCDLYPEVMGWRRRGQWARTGRYQLLQAVFHAEVGGRYARVTVRMPEVILRDFPGTALALIHGKLKVQGRKPTFVP